MIRKVRTDNIYCTECDNLCKGWVLTTSIMNGERHNICAQCALELLNKFKEEIDADEVRNAVNKLYSVDGSGEAVRANG